jgi:hypothetical protein
MSHKRYQYKLIEAADSSEFETKLKEAGSQQWSAVGYGILPDGRRSVLMERKTKVHSHHRERKHHHHEDERHTAADSSTTPRS